MTVSQKAEGRGQKAEGRREPTRSRLPAYCLLPAAFLHWALPTILLVYLLLGLLWSLVVPLGEGPDEPAHFQYALFLREERRLPVQSTDPSRSDLPGEGHQPPLAYLLMQPFIGVSSSEEGRLELYGNPRFRWNGGDQLNAYLHGARERPPYQGAFLAWHLARLLSVTLGAASVAFCYATIRRLWPELPSLALGGAALVAFNPQWIFHHALVSNDPLLIALSSALIYAAVVAAEGQGPVVRGQGPGASGRRGYGRRQEAGGRRQ